MIVTVESYIFIYNKEMGERQSPEFCGLGEKGGREGTNFSFLTA